MRMIALTGSDERFDSDFWWGTPLNVLPVACPACQFPDLAHVPQPYFLKRAACRSSLEMFPAAHGNILVKDRLKRVIELLVPGDCNFHPTTVAKSKEPAPWWLMVPNRLMTTGEVKDSIRRCPECAQPVSAHGTQYEVPLPNRPDVLEQSGVDVSKSTNWYSEERGWHLWIEQQQRWRYSLHCDPLMSIRLFNLLTRIGARGMVELGLQTAESRPLGEELDWIETGLRRLAEAGIPGMPDGAMSKEDAAWHRKFLKARGRQIAKPDFRAFEKSHKLQLPPSYRKTLEKCGPLVFTDVDEIEGVSVQLLPLEEVDAVSMRHGIADFEDEPSKAVDCVVFATAENGDWYCFDAAGKHSEKPVYLYNHEGHFLEPYSAHFVECLRRFSDE